MILKQLQELIGGIYDIRVTHDVYDFLITDRQQLPAGAPSGPTDEQLLVAQRGGDVGVTLYLDAQLLDRLQHADPLESLHGGNVADFCTALEGVSHFVYLAWNAGFDKRVSLRELEMQAEIDKYVTSYWLMKRQLPDRFPAELLRVLFERARVDSRLAQGREGLYRDASRYAEKFCRKLDGVLRASRRHSGREVLAELRRFYRLTDASKVAHIERSA